MVADRSSGRLQRQLLPLLMPGLATSGAAGERMRGVAVERREGVVVVDVEERGGVVVTACGERGAMAVEEREGAATTIVRGSQQRR